MKCRIIKGCLVRPFGRLSVGDEIETDAAHGAFLVEAGLAEACESKPKKKAKRKTKGS